MHTSIKKILFVLPVPIKRTLIKLREFFFFFQSITRENKEYGQHESLQPYPISTTKKNILIYHSEGLSFGGTEKNLQVIANGLCDEFNVFFMYADSRLNSREAFIKKEVTLLPFIYTIKEPNYPYYINGMNPHIKDIIREKQINLIIATGSGHPEYPMNTIYNIPIIMINIFGSPNLQKNIIRTVFVSKTVHDFSEKYTGTKKTNQVLFVPVTQPSHTARDYAKTIRDKFNFKDTDFVFGRIGRNSDDIFDEIGIRAFQKIVKENPNAKYLIMSPPPILEKIVREESIPNVYFLPPSSDERDIWAFHYAIDGLAHFRYDGETFGLNIAESLYVGNPVISHTSKIWNAHLDYLHRDFSRVSSIGNIDEYAAYMIEYIKLKAESPEKWHEMRVAAELFAKNHFSEKTYIQEIKKIVQSA